MSAAPIYWFGTVNGWPEGHGLARGNVIGWHDLKQAIDFAISDLDLDTVDDAEPSAVGESERVANVERVRPVVDAEVVEGWRKVEPGPGWAHAVRVRPHGGGG